MMTFCPGKINSYITFFPGKLLFFPREGTTLGYVQASFTVLIPKDDEPVKQSAINQIRRMDDCS